jgi:DNA-binding transcriptional MerR regulator
VRVRYRVEELAARADVSVDTVRYYQARDLLPAPDREGRLAWYRDAHLDRLAAIRRWQGRGLSLAVIGRLLRGDLDHADEQLVAALAREDAADGPAAGAGRWLTLDELATASGIAAALLQAVEREGLLVPRRVGGEDRYTEADVAAATAGLSLLEHGLPLPDLLALARDHDAAMRAVAARAVELFDRHVRHRLRDAGLPDDEAARRLLDAFETLLPATLAIVAHHFRRTLLAVAQEHIERVGSDDERRLVSARAEHPAAEAVWAR